MGNRGRSGAPERPAAEGERESAGSASGPGPARPDRGRADRRRAARRVRRRRQRSLVREIPLIIVVALGITLLLQTFVVQVFSIPSGSMENTLLPGDRILVNKMVYRLRPIERGDIVVFSGSGSWDPPTPATTWPTPPAASSRRRTWSAGRSRSSGPSRTGARCRSRTRHRRPPPRRRPVKAFVKYRPQQCSGRFQRNSRSLWVWLRLSPVAATGGGGDAGGRGERLSRTATADDSSDSVDVTRPPGSKEATWGIL